jgi:hypothetical protein
MDWELRKAVTTYQYDPWVTGTVITISTVTPATTVPGTGTVVKNATPLTVKPKTTTPGAVVTRSPGGSAAFAMPDVGLPIVAVVVIAVLVVGVAFWRVRGIEEDEEKELFDSDTQFGEEVIDDLDDDQDATGWGRAENPPGTAWIQTGDRGGAALLPPDDDAAEDAPFDDEDLPLEDDEDEPLDGGDGR